MLNVLIVIFLVMNVGLYFYNENQETSNYTLTEERADLVKDVLENKDIELGDNCPREYFPMPMLIIKPPIYEAATINEHFF